MMGASTSREVWMSSFIGGIITVFMSSPLNMITTHIIAAKKVMTTNNHTRKKEGSSVTTRQ